MRKIFLSALLMVLPSAALAQDDPNWPSLSYLRSDYRESVVVAHVRVTEAEVVNRIPGLEDWRVVCEVIEPFKAKSGRDKRLPFTTAPKRDLKRIISLRIIVFLHRNYHEQEKRWVYAVIENSTLPYNEDRIQKLRRIKRAAAARFAAMKP